MCNDSYANAFYSTNRGFLAVCQKTKISLETITTFRKPVRSNACSGTGLNKLEIAGPSTVCHNLTFGELFEHKVKNNVVLESSYL